MPPKNGLAPFPAVVGSATPRHEPRQSGDRWRSRMPEAFVNGWPNTTKAAVSFGFKSSRLARAGRRSHGQTIPQDFLDALEAMPAAKAFFQTLDRKNLYSIYYRLHTAKRPETRAKRLAQILAQLDRGERFH